MSIRTIYIYMLVFLVAALLVEICFFNFYYVKGCFTSWERIPISLSYQDAVGNSYAQLQRGITSIALPTQEGLVLKNIAFELVSDEHFMVKGSVLVKNELRRHLFTKGGTFVVASNGSALVKINNHAATYEIALVFEGALPGNALLKNLVLNQAPSLAFSKLRFSLTFLTLFLTWLVLKGKFYQTEVNYRFHRKLYLLATVPTFLLVGAVFYYNNPVTGHNAYLACQFPQECTFALGTDDHSLLRPRPKTQQEIYNSHLYDQQFDAFLKGQLHFDLTVSTKLLNVANPYEISNLYQDQVGYLFDRTYYQGKYYSYYGITPILMSYFPVYALTGMFPTPSLTNLILATFATAMMFWAIWSLCVMLQLKANLLLLILGANAVVLSSGILFLQGGLEHYFQVVTAAISWCCFELVAVCQLLKASSRGKGLLWVALAALAVVLVEFSRPNLMLVALALLVPILLRWRSTYQVKRTDTILEFALMAAVLVAGAALQLTYNYVRFDQPLQFGQNIVLSAYDAAKTPLLSLYLFIDSLHHLVLSDYVFIDEFPFIAIGAMSFEDSGNVRFGQDMVGITAFWLSFGLIFLLYRGARTQEARAVMPLNTTLNVYLIGMATMGLITGLFSCLLTDVYTQRYATEVVFVFSIISLLLILHYVRFAADFSSKLVYLFFVGALLQTCVIGALGGAIGPQQFRLNPEGFVELINIFRPFA